MTPAPFSQTIRRDHKREMGRGGDFMSLQSLRRTKYLFLNSLFNFVYCPMDFANLNSIYL
jgi:hypothetical protein